MKGVQPILLNVLQKAVRVAHFLIKPTNIVNPVGEDKERGGSPFLHEIRGFSGFNSAVAEALQSVYEIIEGSDIATHCLLELAVLLGELDEDLAKARSGSGCRKTGVGKDAEKGGGFRDVKTDRMSNRTRVGERHL